jgi:hypothetical protein
MVDPNAEAVNACRLQGPHDFGRAFIGTCRRYEIGWQRGRIGRELFGDGFEGSAFFEPQRLVCAQFVPRRNRAQRRRVVLGHKESRIRGTLDAAQ